jgi:hypothetical protein
LKGLGGGIAEEVMVAPPLTEEEDDEDEGQKGDLDPDQPLYDILLKKLNIEDGKEKFFFLFVLVLNIY